MNIKEIAEESGAVAYSPAPLRAVRGYSFTFEQLQNFAEALIAELAKGNEPVCTAAMLDEWFLAKSGLDPKLPIYTIPPTVSQIEQETAEACAKMLDSMYVTERGAEAIRSGAWKEFKND